MSKGLDFLVSICENGNAAELRRYPVEYFVGNDEIACYQFCVNHVRRFSVLPVIDTLHEDTGVQLPIAEDTVEYYASELVERKLYNDLREPFNELRTALNSQDMESSRSIIGRMSSVSRTHTIEQDLLSAYEVGQLTRERYDLNHRVDGLIGVPSGWRSLDNESSGYQPGDLNAWVSRPEMGKTWLLLRQIDKAHQAGANVLVVTMEMILQTIGNRFFSMVAGVDPRQARRGMLSTDDSDRLQEAIERYRNDNRFFMYQGNMGQGTDGVEAVVAEHRPDIVFIDGIYMLRSPKTNAQARQNIQVSDVLDDCKRMAISKHCSVVCTSQYNREAGGRGRKGSLENIGFTDTFSMHCSLIYSIKAAHARARDKQTRIIETIKGREGESATIAIDYKFRPIRFGQIPMGLVMNPQSEETDLEWMQDG